MAQNTVYFNNSICMFLDPVLTDCETRHNSILFVSDKLRFLEYTRSQCARCLGFFG